MGKWRRRLRNFSSGRAPTLRLAGWRASAGCASRAGPTISGRDLVDEPAQQDQLGRNGGRVLSRIQPEQAEVHLHIAVRRLQAAERQNPLPGTRQMGIV